MNCAFDKEKLTGYYDGELPAAEKAEVERHIASCSECLRDLGELKSAALLVKELPRLRAPRSIAEGVSREIAASGKVHVFAKVRRNLMWVAAAAAGVFVMMNVMYLAKRESSPDPALARVRETATVAPMAEIPVARDQGAAKAGADRNAAEALREKSAFDERQTETRKNLADAEKKAAPKADEARRALDAAEANRERGAKELAKSGDPKAFEAPVPPAAAKPVPAPVTAPAPAAPSAPAAAAKAEPKEAPAPTPAPKPEGLGKREAEGVSPKDAEQMKLKQATLDNKGKDGAAEAGPTHLTLACTQIAKTRPELEAALGKLGCALPPPPAPMKGIKSMAREPDTIAVELTETQIAKLQKDFEKQGEAKLVVGAPEDPVVLSWLRGGSLAFGRKEVASGGAGAPARKKPESKEDSKEKDAAEEALAGKAPAEAPADKAGEPRRKVIFHVVEMKVRPADPPPK